jgi:hypothetical protein
VLKSATSSRGVGIVADRIALSLQPGVTDADVAAINTAAARLGAGAAQAYLNADKCVTSASPDSIMHTTAVGPDDPLLSQMPDLPQIQAFSAWSRYRGDGVKIAVLDTGMNESHPDLVGKVDDHANLMWFSSGVNDQFGHGTHVAGTAAAAGNNTEGIAGIAMIARLMNGKIADDDGSSTTVSMSSGIYWAVDHGANVINISSDGDRDCSGTYAFKAVCIPTPGGLCGEERDRHFDQLHLARSQPLRDVVSFLLSSNRQHQPGHAGVAAGQHDQLHGREPDAGRLVRLHRPGMRLAWLLGSLESRDGETEFLSPERDDARHRPHYQHANRHRLLPQRSDVRRLFPGRLDRFPVRTGWSQLEHPCRVRFRSLGRRLHGNQPRLLRTHE